MNLPIYNLVVAGFSLRKQAQLVVAGFSLRNLKVAATLSNSFNPFKNPLGANLRIDSRAASFDKAE